ncbi:MAG: NAD-dependent deacylase [Lentisphaerae bacterium]|nr:NAD-dependent deacylase [Lentisphaerota bacterium]
MDVSRSGATGGAHGSAAARLAGLLAGARRIAVLTGAGMSTESGVPDFRSAAGLYATRVSEEIFDIEAFRRAPEGFYAFARTFFAEVRSAQPNPGHRALAELQGLPGKEVTVATQNIDTLHQQAGTAGVLPVHGTLETSTCLRCGHRVSTESLWPAVAAGGVPRHDCGGVYKPDIVFFGEMLPEDVLERARRAFERADLAVVLGTSLAVYPAAMLPELRRPGVPLAIVNRGATGLDDRSTLVCHEAIGEVLPAAVAAAGGVLRSDA